MCMPYELTVYIDRIGIWTWSIISNLRIKEVHLWSNHTFIFYYIPVIMRFEQISLILIVSVFNTVVWIAILISKGPTESDLMAKEIRNRIKELCSFTISQLRSERILNLLRIGQETRGLNLFFATLCVIDLFGVFPIVTLPSALITCGLLFVL